MVTTRGQRRRDSAVTIRDLIKEEIKPPSIVLRNEQLKRVNQNPKRKRSNEEQCVSDLNLEVFSPAVLEKRQKRSSSSVDDFILATENKENLGKNVTNVVNFEDLPSAKSILGTLTTVQKLQRKQNRTKFFTEALRGKLNLTDVDFESFKLRIQTKGIKCKKSGRNHVAKTYKANLNDLESYQTTVKALQTELKAINGDLVNYKLFCQQQLLGLQSSFETKLVSEQERHHNIFSQLEQAEKDKHSLKADLLLLQKERRQLRNEIQTLKGTVRVVVRVKPNSDLISKVPFKSGGKCISSVQCLEDETSITLSDVSKRRLHEFCFNRVFDQMSEQKHLFEEVSGFVNSALDGCNVCLFSYGQTGSGKTYTMTGDLEKSALQGITPRGIKSILSQIKQLEKQGWTYELNLSVIEIYNESLRDLLADNGDYADSLPLEIRDSSKEILVPNASKVVVKTKKQIFALLKRAQKSRVTAETDINKESSRSHSICTLFIKGEYKDPNPLTKLTKVEGSLSLCDLAGSERLKKSGDHRIKETCNINKSLSALGDVFLALNKKQNHIPFRNSKLTQLLKPCFSGEGKVLMIVNVSSDITDQQETLCSLRFASKVNATQVTKSSARAKISYPEEEEE